MRLTRMIPQVRLCPEQEIYECIACKEVKTKAVRDEPSLPALFAGPATRNSTNDRAT
jgi:hypothetical protein